jgi:hypothetical protein
VSTNGAAVAARTPEATTKNLIKSHLSALGKAAAPAAYADAALRFFQELGYESDKTADVGGHTASTFQSFVRENAAVDFRTDPEHGHTAVWKSVHLLFQLTDDEIAASGRQANPAFVFDSDSRINPSNAQSYLVFALDLSARPDGKPYSRTALANIARELNRVFPVPLLVLFRHDDGRRATLAITDRRPNKRDAERDVLGKVTLIKDIRLADPHRAHLEILFDLSFPELLDKHRQKGLANFDALHKAWRKVLDTSELNKKFYQSLADWYFWARKEVTFPGEERCADDNARETYRSEGVIRLITRLMFVWFLKEKGLVPEELFERGKLQALLTDFEGEGSSFYKAILQNLFFATLNTEIDLPRQWKKDDRGSRNANFMVHNVWRYKKLFRNEAAVKQAEDLFNRVPFLNGGLFECLDRSQQERVDGFSDRADNPLRVPDSLFFCEPQKVDLREAYGVKTEKACEVRGLIDLLDRYKFTVDENTPVEEEVALDPELLGKVFENLLASFNPETQTTARKQSGSFYTPRVIVDYMVDESLVAYLGGRLTGDAAENERRLRLLVAYNELKPREDIGFTGKEIEDLVAAIDNVRILDPACGSGAFPMGALQKLVYLLGKLDPHNEAWKARQIATAEQIADGEAREAAIRSIEEAFRLNELDYGRKLYLIENGIYGVDIQPIAVQISKLRFFISLVINQPKRDDAPNFGIRPLPNLETKLVAANTLAGLHTGAITVDELEPLKKRLREVRRRHFEARSWATKRKYREQDREIRAEMAAVLQSIGWGDATAAKIAAWDPYDQNARSEFFEPEYMFNIGDGFDVVIGNPPYVKANKFKELKDTLAKQYTTYKGNADLFVYFFESGIRFLRPGGHLCFITSNKYFRSDYADKLRKLFAEKTAIRSIADFGDAPVFTAIAYPTILLTQKATPKPGHAIQFLNWTSGAPVSEFGRLFHEYHADLLQADLRSKGWRLATSDDLRILDRFETSGMAFGTFVNGRFYRGVVTGYNEAFVVPTSTKDELVRRDPKAEALFRPFIRGRDVKRWCAEDTDLHLIYVPWDFKINNYPSVRQWLESHKPVLQSRPEVKQKRYPWYAMSRYAADYAHEFTVPKIVYPDIYEHQSFAWDEDGNFAGNTVYMIPGAAKWLLGFLNSVPVEWY